MKTFNKIISLALCVFMLCSVMVMPAFAEGEAAMLATSGDIGTQVHWEYADGVLTISKPETFTGEWGTQNYAYINYVKVDGGKVVDVPKANISSEVEASNKVYTVACPWGKYTFKTTAETDGSYMAASVDYTHITKIVIGEGIESVPAYAFCNNNAAGSPSHTAATEVVFPTSIKSIGIYSFKKAGLTSLNLENTSLKTIGDRAFENCPIAGVVTMPSSIETIGSGVFCANAKTGDEVNAVAKMTGFVIPADAKITKISSQLLDCQKLLQFVVLPASINEIGDYAFRKHWSSKPENAKLNILFLGDAPTTVSTKETFSDIVTLFYSADKAASWTASDAVARLTASGTMTADRILPVKAIPASITDCGGINKTGFWFYDSASKTLDICGNGNAMGATTWGHNNRPWGNDRAANEIENIRINDGVTMNAFASSFGGTGAPHKKVKTMYVGDGVAAMDDDFLGTSPIETLTFSPNSALTSIGARAFANNELTEVILPDTVEEIGSMAFDMYGSTNIKLKKLYLGTSLQTIGDYAFRKCKNLESVVIPATVTSIGKNAFTNELSTTTGLKVVYFKGKIPENALLVGTNDVTTVFNNNYQAQFYVTDPEDEGKVFKMSTHTSKTTKLMPKSKIDASITLEADGTAKARIYNFSDASKRFDLYSAAYDSNSALTAVTTKSATVAAGNKIPVIKDLSTTTSGATKAFLWDSNLAPFAVVQ